MATPSSREKQAQRLGQKGLRQQLCERFLNSYGFEKGRCIIPTIVDDILSLVQQYYSPQRDQQHNQIVYTTASANATLTRGKTMSQTQQQAVCLTIIDPGDTQLYAQGKGALRRARFVRWLYEAQAQGALLSAADIAYISGLCHGLVADELCRYERETTTTLPLRGTVHDASSKLTHKTKIIDLYLQGYVASEIARATDHSLAAVEHYLHDFQLVRELYPRYDVIQIAHLLQRGPSLIQQHVDIIENQAKRDTPVREPSASLQSGSHEPAADNIDHHP